MTGDSQGGAPKRSISNSARRRSHLLERGFRALCLSAAILPLALLVYLIADVTIDGLGRIDWQFLTSYPSRKAEKAGILPGLVGSLYLVTMTAAFAFPIGVGAAIYLQEYSRRGRFARIVETNIANLAGVPSVLYGLLGLEIFARVFGMGRSLIAGSLTLALLVMPVIVIASREALRNVPHSMRMAGMALGATRWQVIRQIVLPSAMPTILTGTILAISRALGEAAPLIILGALTYVTFLPDGVDAPFTALPIQIFNWVSRPQEAFAVNAAAGIVVLILMLLTLNGVAILLRDRMRRKLEG